MIPESDFLSYSADKLEQLCGRVEACLGKLSGEQIWMRGAENQNAAGNLVLHLTGNVRQWILSGVGGEPDHRARDREFAARGGASPDDLAAGLRSTVDQACRVVRSLPHGRLTDHVTIQGHEVSVLQAIYHVVEHFSGHAGQIILLTKAFTGEDLGFYAYLSNAGQGQGQALP